MKFKLETYKLLLSEKVRLFLKLLDEKSKRICIKNLRKLEENPYPGKGSGDKEKLIVRNEEIYRLHIGRSFTAFYIILKNKKLVRIIELLPIEKAHKKYRTL